MPIGVARLVLARDKTRVGPDLVGVLEAMGIIKVGHNCLRRDAADSVDLHHALGARIFFGDTIELRVNRFPMVFEKFQLNEFEIKFASPKFGR